jgi:hypothetical protein
MMDSVKDKCEFNKKTLGKIRNTKPRIRFSLLNECCNLIPLPLIARSGITKKNNTTIPPKRLPTDISNSELIYELKATDTSVKEEISPSNKNDTKNDDVCSLLDIFRTE